MHAGVAGDRCTPTATYLRVEQLRYRANGGDAPPAATRDICRAGPIAAQLSALARLATLAAVRRRCLQIDAEDRSARIAFHFIRRTELAFPIDTVTCSRGRAWADVAA